MTRSNNYKPFMAYLDPKDYLRLKKFAKETKSSMSNVMREAISQRMAPTNPYVTAFNEGIESCIEAVNNMQAAQMRFPSGKSFAELIEEELLKGRIKEVQHEESSGSST